MAVNEARDSKVCRRHTQYFPSEDDTRPISEFANNGKHSYCRRCMSFISKENRQRRTAAGTTVSPQKRKAILGGSTPLPRRKTTAQDEVGVTLPLTLRGHPPEMLKDSPLGKTPALDTPFVVVGQPQVYAFKNYWYCGDNVTVIGCIWEGRDSWRTQMNVFRLSGIRLATDADLQPQKAAADA